jgi:hypothetical protein
MSYAIVEKDYRDTIVGILVSDAPEGSASFIRPASPTANKVLFSTEQEARAYIVDHIGRDTSVSFYRVFQNDASL